MNTNKNNKTMYVIVALWSFLTSAAVFSFYNRYDKEAIKNKLIQDQNEKLDILIAEQKKYSEILENTKLMFQSVYNKYHNNQIELTEDELTLVKKISKNFKKQIELNVEVEPNTENTNIPDVLNSIDKANISDTVDIVKAFQKDLSKLKKLFEDIVSSSNYSISDFNLDKIYELLNSIKFYEYLNSITITQELALINGLLIFLLILGLTNIVSALFANEILKYFDIESKYPKLTKYLQLRITLQKYYFMWGMLQMFLLCFFGIGLNIFTYYTGI